VKPTGNDRTRRRHAQRRTIVGLAGIASACMAGVAVADETTDAVAPVVVTATRVPIEADQLPAMLTRISGADLARRGADDLRTALALVSGVEAPPGGDAGPASAVPSFWGLHEFDAFLLVVDGVPWGGAFNPAISTLDLTNVEHIEVLKGPSPVALGQNAFVGVIQVIHAPAGEATPLASAALGQHGSFEASLVSNLPAVAGFRQTVTLSAENQGFSDRFQRVRDIEGQWRTAGDLAGGKLKLSLDFAVRRDRPQSPTVLENGQLTTRTSLDANQNPSDGRIDNDSWHATGLYDRQTAIGLWSTLASVAYTGITDVRGFLRANLTDNGTPNADYQNQRRRILDGYVDTHLAFTGPAGAKLLVGVDVLAGSGRQISRNGEYHVPLAGRSLGPATTSLPVDEINTLADTRVFAGQYLQAELADGPFTLLAGLRLNETSESRRSAHVDTADPANNDARGGRRTGARLSGNLGVSWRAWSKDREHLVLYADLRRTSQTGAVDFGPDYRPDILKVERASIYEAGLKGAALSGALEYEASAFLLDDHNLEVATTDANGAPLLQNAGAERLKGVEAEARYHAGAALDLFLSAAWHDAYFTRFTASDGGRNLNVAGNSLTLSPPWLLAAGIVAAPREGLGGSLVVNFADRRWLDLGNTASTPAYATVDAGLTWKTGRYRMFLRGTNLTDRRDAVTASEFGDGSYYRLPGRKVLAGVELSF
jgi:iron complex outermembrane recepter protein